MTMRLRVGLAWPGKRAASARIVSLPLTTTTVGWLCKRTQPVRCSLWLGVSYNLARSLGRRVYIFLAEQAISRSDGQRLHRAR